jgi:hypothetical protein
VDDSSTEFGDPVLNALIGWHEGNWHWNVGALVNVPIGVWSNSSVRRQGFVDRLRLGLSEGLAYLFVDARRPAYGIASAGG